MDRQGRCNRPVKCLDDGGDCDDREDHVETRLKKNNYCQIMHSDGYRRSQQAVQV